MAIVKYITFPQWFRYSGITLFPFIFINKTLEGKDNSILINHEKIHIKQQIECLVVFFYILYLLSFMWQFLKTFNCFSFDKAYRNIIFEREAYTKQYDLNYLNTRSMYAWLTLSKE